MLGADLVLHWQSGAMWLEASDQPNTEQEVFGTINAAITGTFLLTQGLLPVLKRSQRPDIVTIGSIGALPNAPLHSVTVPFYAAKHAQAVMATAASSKCCAARWCVHSASTRTIWKTFRQQIKAGYLANPPIAVLFFRE